LTAITQYIPTIYSPFLINNFQRLRTSIIQHFKEELQNPLSTLYDKYAIDLILLIHEDKNAWKFMVIEVNPFFELTGEGLFESEEGRKILNGEAEVEYPVLRIQQMRMVDPTEKHFLAARRRIEKEMGIHAIESDNSL
jgi:hypothetical protein